MIHFSERFSQLRSMCVCVQEAPANVDGDLSPIPEHVLQGVWYDHLFPEAGLETEEGHRIEILSPGWWNRQEGPDFRGAQILFNGTLHSGDVEVHLEGAGWRAHGHHLDERYNDVVLHVVLEGGGDPVTSEGKRIPTLVLGRFIEHDLRVLADLVPAVDVPCENGPRRGRCGELSESERGAGLGKLIDLAGEWRVLNKARALRERMDQVGRDQAVYEALLYACGFGHFKHHFRAVARHLPYDRARQLVQEDTLLLETALLRMAGLLPETLPEGTTAAPHFGRLRALQRERLSGLRALPLEWRRVGVRPNNNPERRLAGAARFVARTGRLGLVDTLEEVWREDMRPIERRRRFEGLFPGATGFWATHCTWTGKRMAKPSAPIGGGRVRSIIGNVFIPAGLAVARQERDRVKEERVYALFESLPKEPDNHIVRVMGPRLLQGAGGRRLGFRTQQGLLQVYLDWCEGNPSCHNCTMLRYLASD